MTLDYSFTKIEKKNQKLQCTGSALKTAQIKSQNLRRNYSFIISTQIQS